jgi:flagellar FliJ protein
MKQSKRMQPVAEMAQQQADTAVKNVAECNRRYTDTQKQLNELLSYRDDYANGLRHKGLKANQIKDYGLFMGRLNQAIEQQQAVLNNAGRSLAASKQVCSEKQQRAKTIDSVVSRYQQVERREQLRREQCDSDEHALRLIRRQDS